MFQLHDRVYALTDGWTTVKNKTFADIKVVSGEIIDIEYISEMDYLFDDANDFVWITIKHADGTHQDVRSDVLFYLEIDARRYRKRILDDYKKAKQEGGN